MIFWAVGEHQGRVGIASRPRGGDWLDDEIRSWKASGVTVVVSCLDADEVKELGLEREEALCANHGLVFRWFPLPDRGVPSGYSTSDALARTLADSVRGGAGVLVHCRQGIGRSALLAAAVLVRLGSSPATALDHIASARTRPVPDTPEQRAWVEHLPIPDPRHS